MTKWTPEQLPDFSGRTVVITGASSGIGLAAARHLEKHGAHVIAAVRNVDKTRQVLGTTADIRPLDLADLASVRTFSESVTDSIDILINNAGVMAVPLKRTTDGFEMQFGTNHLGHFALTALLLDKVTDRVVTVSSTAHRMGRMRFNDPNWENGYQRWAAYGQSKLANLLFTRELQRRLTARGSHLRALAVHPGLAATNLQSHSESKVQNAAMELMNRLVAQSADQGSWPTLYAASQDIPGDSFVGPDGFGQMRGFPTLVSRTGAAKNDSDARTLWELSQRLTGVRCLAD